MVLERVARRGGTHDQLEIALVNYAPVRRLPLAGDFTSVRFLFAFLGYSPPSSYIRSADSSDQLISLQTSSMDVLSIAVQHAITLLDQFTPALEGDL